MNEIVSIHGREAVTDSLKVSEVFKKKHKNVLATIEALLDDPEVKRRLIFKPRDYTDERGKTQPAYEMNRDGFTFLTMGFTGEKARRFKFDYIDAFNKMEVTLLNQKNLSWQQERCNGKVARHSETDAVARFVEYATSQGSQSARMYYVNITKMTHHALSLASQLASPTLRDTLEAMQLNFLATAEYLIEMALDEGMQAGRHYRDVYQMAREKVLAFAGSLPIQRQISA